MGFGKPVFESQRLRTGGQNAVDRNIQMVVQEQERIAVGDAGVSAGIEGVQLYRLSEHPPRQLIVRSSSAVAGTVDL